MGTTVAIIGSGLAGARAAAALRSEGFDGRVVLVGEEPHLPYDRPPLSKGVLRGEQQSYDILLHPEDYYSENEIELELGAQATELSPRERRVTLSNGSSLRADRFLLCTGGAPRPLPVPGSELEGVHTLRSLADAVAIRGRLWAGACAVIVGAGWIGTEVAASARILGCEVTVIEIDPRPFARALGEELGRACVQLHKERGVELLAGVGVAEIVGRERVEAVRTTDGEELPADVVIVGVGMQPRTGLAKQAGLEVSDGVVVDEYGETSVPGIFAAGDVARRRDPLSGRLVRQEHWQTAQQHAAATARSLLGQRQPFAEVPWFWSDQYGAELQVAGEPGEGDEVVSRGDPEDLSFVSFYLRGGRLVGAAGINRPREVRAALKLIESGRSVERRALADPSVDLRRVAREALAT